MRWKWITTGASIFLITLILLANSDWFWQMVAPVYYKDTLVKYGEEYAIDPLLAAAIVKVESNFYSGAKSPRGAIGLMQIMPATGQEIAIKLKMRPFTSSDLYNPEVNIRIGLYYLAGLIKEFNGDIPLALAAYNGGLGNAKKWVKAETGDYRLKSIPFPETRNFVQTVLWNYQWFKDVQKIRSFLQFRKQENDFS